MVLIFYIFDTTCYMILHSKHPSSFHCCGLLIHALNLFGPGTAKAKSIGPLDADLPSVEIQLGRRQAVDGCCCLVSWSVFFKTSWSENWSDGEEKLKIYMVCMVTCGYLHTRLWSWKCLVGVLLLCAPKKLDCAGAPNKSQIFVTMSSLQLYIQSYRIAHLWRINPQCGTSRIQNINTAWGRFLGRKHWWSLVFVAYGNGTY